MSGNPDIMPSLNLQGLMSSLDLSVGVASMEEYDELYID